MPNSRNYLLFGTFYLYQEKERMDEMSIEELLKEYGLELPADKVEEFNTKFKENYKSTTEYEKQVKKLEGERDNYKQKYDTAAETLKGFDGVDVKDLQEQIETYKKKIEDDNKEYNAKIAERDFNDALSKELEAFKFTSNAARESITGQIKAAGLKLVDGKIVGLSDMITSIKEKAAAAFAAEAFSEELAALGQGGLCLNCETCTFPNCGFGKGR